MILHCPQCKQKYELPENMRGERLECAACGCKFDTRDLRATRRMNAPAATPTNKNLMMCDTCGGNVARNANMCPHCGAPRELDVDYTSLLAERRERQNKTPIVRIQAPWESIYLNFVGILMLTGGVMFSIIMGLTGGVVGFITSLPLLGILVAGSCFFFGFSTIIRSTNAAEFILYQIRDNSNNK